MTTIALNFQEIKKIHEDPNIKPFINNCNWGGVNYLSKIEDWTRFEKNNWRVAVNTIFDILKKKNVPLILQKSFLIVKNK